MAKWNARRESGILRKKCVEDKHEDLLVFGYACKLFRDDERALYIDQGKHLIPWMGQASLKIDRYDCRGALSELSLYEASSEDYDAKRWLGLKESERQIELLCDEERYRSLKSNDEDLELYQEEELKRIAQKGNEVHYNYDVPADPENSQELPENMENEELFVPSPDLQVPLDMKLPKTVKENTRIEKTANFISKQGLQMEILIKTKQADNPQFSFMNKDDHLYAYYKHLLTAIKNGQYKVETGAEDERQDDSMEQEEHSEHYLHPSLQATSLQPVLPPLPAMVYKPSPDCTYSQLVNRIQGVQSEPTPPPPPEELSYEEQYRQYYYSSQYYEYYAQMAQQYKEVGFVENPDMFNKSAPVVPTPSVLNSESFLKSEPPAAQYFPKPPTNPYAQIVSNLAAKNALPEPPFTNNIEPKPPLQAPLPDTEITKGPILYKHDEIQAPPVPPTPTTDVPQTPIVEIKKPLLSLAQYGSDSENENSNDSAGEEPSILLPPTEVQLVIDKMASYVLKNGKDFENIVKAKGDSRFEFLNSSHKFHAYYNKKINEYSSNLSKQAESRDRAESKKVSPKVKKQIAPVSFSIKKARDETPKEIKSALPIEESDEDQEDNKDSTPVPSEISKSTTGGSTTTPPSVTANTSLGNPIDNSALKHKIPQSQISDNKKTSVEDFILDLIDLTDDTGDKSDSNYVKDFKQGQIVSEAKEKLALQLERKRKAAAFLKLKSVESSKSDERITSSEYENVRYEKHKSSRNEKFKSGTSDIEEGEIKKPKKSSKKKKSHKRKRSKSRSSSNHKSKEHRKSKKRHKKDVPSSSGSSSDS